MSDQTLFIEFRPNMRRLIADAIESLILLLDEIDGDENLEEEPDAEDGLDIERCENPPHLSGGNGPVPSKEENIKSEIEDRERAEKDRRDNEIWATASAAHYAKCCYFAPWTPENQRRAEAGLPLLTAMERRS